MKKKHGGQIPLGYWWFPSLRFQGEKNQSITFTAFVQLQSQFTMPGRMDEWRRHKFWCGEASCWKEQGTDLCPSQPAGFKLNSTAVWWMFWSLDGCIGWPWKHINSPVAIWGEGGTSPFGLNTPIRQFGRDRLNSLRIVTKLVLEQPILRDRCWDHNPKIACPLQWVFFAALETLSKKAAFHSSFSSQVLVWHS